MSTLQQVPARQGRAVSLKAGQSIRIVNTHGHQVVDTWAFNAQDLNEFLSMEHMRAAIDRVRPKPGDKLVTNKRRPILTLVEDTSPGAHDTLSPLATSTVGAGRGRCTGLPRATAPPGWRRSA